MRSTQQTLQTWKWEIISSLTLGEEEEPLALVLGRPT